MFKKSIKVINGLIEGNDVITHLYDTQGNNVLITPVENGVLVIKFYCEADVIDMLSENRAELVDSGFTEGLAVAFALDGNISAIIFDEDGELDNNFLAASFEHEYAYVIDSLDYLDGLVEQEDIEEDIADEVRMLSIL